MDVKKKIAKDRYFWFDVKRDSLINRYGLLLCVPSKLLEICNPWSFFWWTPSEAESLDMVPDLRAVLHNTEHGTF